MEFKPQYSSSPFIQKVKNYKVFSSLGKTFLVFLAMFLVFLLPNSLTVGIFSINPREFSFHELFGIMGSWLVHANGQHLIGNMTSMLFPLIYFFYQVRQRSSIFWFLFLVFMSGVITWLIGSPGSAHIGASGLAYALFGFILSGTFRSIGGFIISCLTLFFYLTPMLTGLIPQEGISWAGHAGGAIGGFLVGRHFNKINSGDEFAYKMKTSDKIKQAWSDFKWRFSKRRNRFYK